MIFLEMHSENNRLSKHFRFLFVLLSFSMRRHIPLRPDKKNYLKHFLMILGNIRIKHNV